MKRDERTYRGVSERFDEWVEIEAEKPMPERRPVPQQPYTPEPQGPDMSKNIFAAIGVGIGLALLALSALSFWTAANWVGIARNGAATGYAVVGFFLLLAGAGGILATLNHNYRVLAHGGGAQGPPRHD